MSDDEIDIIANSAFAEQGKFSILDSVQNHFRKKLFSEWNDQFQRSPGIRSILTVYERRKDNIEIINPDLIEVWNKIVLR